MIIFREWMHDVGLRRDGTTIVITARTGPIELVFSIASMRWFPNQLDTLRRMLNEVEAQLLAEEEENKRMSELLQAERRAVGEG